MNRKSKQTSKVRRQMRRRNGTVAIDDGPRAADSQHAHAIEEYTAATLRREVAGDVSTRLAIMAVAERITNFEWLHSRQLSRIGVADGEEYARSLYGTQSLIRPRRLFERSFENGGTWDW
jgi:hypothetical protein